MAILPAGSPVSVQVYNNSTPRWWSPESSVQFRGNIKMSNNWRETSLEWFKELGKPKDEKNLKKPAPGEQLYFCVWIYKKTSSDFFALRA